MADVYSNAGIEAARIAGELIEMDQAAEELALAARARAAGHGGFGATIHTARDRGQRGVTDRIVYSDHPRAFNIEHGHLLVRDGKTIGYVKGIHVLANAIKDVPEVDE